MFWGPHHLCRGKGRQGVRGARRNEGSERGRGARGSELSKMNVILGFKAPTTSGGKNFDDDK